MEGFDYSRRRTVEVRAGRVAIGGDNPVRLQSMTNTSTMDTDGSVRQSAQLAAAGSELVRLTAQGVREADNIGVISSRLREAGVDVPLVADIHFNPRALLPPPSLPTKYASIPATSWIRVVCSRNWNIPTRSMQPNCSGSTTL